jgi:hypothetical protein
MTGDGVGTGEGVAGATGVGAGVSSSGEANGAQAHSVKPNATTKDRIAAFWRRLIGTV